jgi:hypothetical protein
VTWPFDLDPRYLAPSKIMKCVNRRDSTGGRDHAGVVGCGGVHPEVAAAAVQAGQALEEMGHLVTDAGPAVAGQPAISLPLGQSESGLPIGVQFVAPYGREDLLLRVAARLEQAMPWKTRTPAVFAGNP